MPKEIVDAVVRRSARLNPMLYHQRCSLEALSGTELPDDDRYVWDLYLTHPTGDYQLKRRMPQQGEPRSIFLGRISAEKAIYRWNVQQTYLSGRWAALQQQQGIRVDAAPPRTATPLPAAPAAPTIPTPPPAAVAPNPPTPNPAATGAPLPAPDPIRPLVDGFQQFAQMMSTWGHRRNNSTSSSPSTAHSLHPLVRGRATMSPGPVDATPPIRSPLSSPRPQ